MAVILSFLVRFTRNFHCLPSFQSGYVLSMSEWPNSTKIFVVVIYLGSKEIHSKTGQKLEILDKIGPFSRLKCYFPSLLASEVIFIEKNRFFSRKFETFLRKNAKNPEKGLFLFGIWKIQVQNSNPNI